MEVTRQHLLEHFQRLTDDALLAELQSGELTEVAKTIAAAELQRRNIVVPTAPAETPPTGQAGFGGDDLALAARYFTAAEAYMLRSRLELEGIPAIVADDHAAQTMWALPVGGVRVLVPAPYLQRAREISAAVERGDYALSNRTDIE